MGPFFDVRAGQSAGPHTPSLSGVDVDVADGGVVRRITPAGH